MIDLNPESLMTKLLASLDNRNILSEKIITTIRYLHLHHDEVFSPRGMMTEGLHYKYGGSLSLIHSCLINRPIHDLDIILNANELSEHAFINLYLDCMNSQGYVMSSNVMRETAISIYELIKNKEKKITGDNNNSNNYIQSPDICLDLIDGNGIEANAKLEELESVVNYKYRLNYNNADLRKEHCKVNFFITSNFQPGIKTLLHTEDPLFDLS